MGGAGNPFAEALIQHLGKEQFQAGLVVDLKSGSCETNICRTPMLGVCKEVVSWTAALRRACQTNCGAR